MDFVRICEIERILKFLKCCRGGFCWGFMGFVVFCALLKAPSLCGGGLGVGILCACKTQVAQKLVFIKENLRYACFTKEAKGFLKKLRYACFATIQRYQAESRNNGSVCVISSFSSC